MQYRNGRWYRQRKPQFLSNREKEFLNDPKGFQEKWGNNYTRQIKYRIREKIWQAIGVIEKIWILSNKDDKDLNKYLWCDIGLNRAEKGLAKGLYSDIISGFLSDVRDSSRKI